VHEKRGSMHAVRPDVRRGVLRKIQLVTLLGSRCTQCGYCANYAALEFHHASGRKDFQLDMRSLANRSWQAVLLEARKCQCCARIATLRFIAPTFGLISSTSW
jgi:hypothetical protein